MTKASIKKPVESHTADCKTKTIPSLSSATVQMSSQQSSSSRKDRGLLIELSGPSAGKMFSLENFPVVIGRGSECDLRFEDNTLSRTHTRILYDGKNFILEDSESLNGCFVNQERIHHHILDDGDCLLLGSKLRFRFQQVSSDEEAVLIRLYNLGVKDELTGVYNRRHMEERIRQEISYANRYGTDVYVLMLDLDHFKRINDIYGHLAGDMVLRSVGSMLHSHVRDEAIVARYGGEEFVVIERDASRFSVSGMAERLRFGVEAMNLQFEDAQIKLTVSIGIASLQQCGHGGSVEQLLACADAALYKAKGNGRNQIVQFGQLA